MEETSGQTPPTALQVDASDDAPRDARAQPSSFHKFRELLMMKRFESRDNMPVLVRPGLFIGSLGAATNLPALQAAGITHILCVAANLPLQFPDLFVYERLALADLPTARLADVLPAGIAFIKQALADGGIVLVHCFVGRSRSASVLLAYLMVEHGMMLDAAMLALKNVRPQVQPNSGFLRQLRAFEKDLFAERPPAPRDEDS